MSLELAATVAERDLDVSLSVGDGEVVAAGCLRPRVVVKVHPGALKRAAA